MSCGVGRSCGPIQPLAWEFPYVMSEALKSPPPKKKEFKQNKTLLQCFYCESSENQGFGIMRRRGLCSPHSSALLSEAGLRFRALEEASFEGLLPPPPHTPTAAVRPKAVLSPAQGRGSCQAGE